MKLSIFNNKNTFISLFGVLKNCSNLISIYLSDNTLHIQGMDKSHICLFEVKIHKKWFQIYEKERSDIDNICIDSVVFYNIISSSHENHIINIHYSGSPDSIHIDLTTTDHNIKSTKGELNKYFKIPLANNDYELISIPLIEYDAEFNINSKKIYEITSQMINFGNDINITCSEETINLITNGITGEMLVNIPIDDLNEYAICEGEILDITYSLNYLHKMCITNKLTNQIEFSISKNYPMKINYDLGNESTLQFFVASKVDV